MAERVDKYDNYNFQPSNFGFYNEVIDNVLEVINTGFSLDDDNIRRLRPSKIYTFEPKGYCLEDLPSLFVWIPVSEPHFPEIGNGTSGRSKTLRKTTFVDIEYYLGEREVEANAQDIRWVAAALEGWLLQNLNVNDIVSGQTEFLGCAFGVEPTLISESRGEKLCMIQKIQIRFSIETQEKKVPSTRR